MEANTPAQPPAARRGWGYLFGQMAINLLIWVGVNLAVFMLVSLLTFQAFDKPEIGRETAFFYSVICAAPTALAAGSYVAGRRVIKMLRNP